MRQDSFHSINHGTARHMRGLSLIELMIALALGLLVILAVGEAYVSSRQTYRTQDALSRLQEGARFALDTLGYDIRMAGQVGCSVDLTQSVNVLNNVAYGDLLGTSIQGFAKGGATPAPFTGSLAQGDGILIVRADDSGEELVSSHTVATSTFNLAALPAGQNHKYSQGDILVVTDCSTAAVFQASGPGAPGATLVHLNAAGLTPGNCSANLGPKPTSGSPCNTTTSKTFPAGSKVMPIVSDFYYIATNPAGLPALYRQQLAKGVPVTQELVEGVKDMSILYGVDTNNDKSADNYVGAGAVANWAQVVSIQISLLMETPEDHVASQNQTYTFNGATVTATDRRIYRVVTTTIGARVRI